MIEGVPTACYDEKVIVVARNSYGYLEVARLAEAHICLNIDF